MIVCNTRILNAPLTGVQRVTIELLKRMPEVETVRPSPLFKGPFGHAWEQGILPFRVGRDTLWSPSNTGPLAVSRQVVTVHDLATLECSEGFSAGFRAYYTWLFPRLLPRLPAIITISNYTKERICHYYGIPEARIHVIPLGVDHEHFTPQPPEKIKDLRQRLGLPERYILFLGALSGRKNVGRLIQAWNMAQSRVDGDIGLVIAGAAGAAHVFDGQALPLLPPRTLLTGRVTDADLPALLSGAMLFVFPSLYEGFGLPPLEAMACGTPCMVSSTTSLPEVVGNAATLTDPLDVPTMADRLVDLLSRPSQLEDLRSAGLAQARRFTWDDCAAATHQVLGSL